MTEEEIWKKFDAMEKQERNSKEMCRIMKRIMKGEFYGKSKQD